jgi:hypothetical protein
MRKAIAKILAVTAILAGGSLNHVNAQDANFDIVRFRSKKFDSAEGKVQNWGAFVGRRKLWRCAEGAGSARGNSAASVTVPFGSMCGAELPPAWCGCRSPGRGRQVTITGSKYFNNEVRQSAAPEAARRPTSPASGAHPAQQRARPSNLK